MYMCAGGYALYYMIATAVAIFFCITVFFIKQPQEINQSANEKKGRSMRDEPIEEEPKPKIEVKGRWIVEILLTPECMVAVCSMSVACVWRIVDNCVCLFKRCAFVLICILHQVLCGMASQWAMILIMTALPLGMVDEHDFSFSQYAYTIQGHLLGSTCTLKFMQVPFLFVTTAALVP
jgi:hypothetical protein